MLVLCGWFLLLGALIWSFGNRDHAIPSDCAIVLGAAVYGTEPSPVFEERIRHAITLYRAGMVSKILFTGGYGKGASHAEGRVGADYAIRTGVPATAVLVETRSQTTQQNLLEAKALMAEASLRTAVIVSDPLHLKRSWLIAKQLEMAAVTSPTPTSRYRSLHSRLPFLFRELYYYHFHLCTGR